MRNSGRWIRSKGRTSRTPRFKAPRQCRQLVPTSSFIPTSAAARAEPGATPASTPARGALRNPSAVSPAGRTPPDPAREWRAACTARTFSPPALRVWSAVRQGGRTSRRARFETRPSAMPARPPPPFRNAVPHAPPPGRTRILGRSPAARRPTGAKPASTTTAVFQNAERTPPAGWRITSDPASPPEEFSKVRQVRTTICKPHLTSAAEIP